MSERALIFDCDGVLADTERDGHRVAFNRTFAEFGLPVAWSEDEYARRLEIAGGKERMASLLTAEFVRDARLPTDAGAQAALLARWHGRKTEIYREIVASGALPPRPGVARLAREALAAGWRVGVASTSAPPSVEAVIDTTLGRDVAERLSVVLAGDVVAHKKPAPDIYELALERLRVPATRAIAIEDSRNGLLAATAAGLTCLVTVNGYTQDEDMSEAALVVTSLGEPGEPARVLAAPHGAPHDVVVRIDDLARLVSGQS